MAAVGWVVAGGGCLPVTGPAALLAGWPRLWPGLACGGTLTPRLAVAAAGWRAQRRRSIRTISTMITIRTMVPMPINMGSSRMRAGSCGTELCTWLARRLDAVAVCPGRRWGPRSGGRGRYFLKTSLIFSKACLRLPLA